MSKVENIVTVAELEAKIEALEAEVAELESELEEYRMKDEVAKAKRKQYNRRPEVKQREAVKRKSKWQEIKAALALADKIKAGEVTIDSNGDEIESED